MDPKQADHPHPDEELVGIGLGTGVTDVVGVGVDNANNLPTAGVPPPLEEHKVPKKAAGRPSSSVVWNNVHIDHEPSPDGSGNMAMVQTCIHCGKTKRAQQMITTWWAIHLVSYDKGCPNCPLEVRHAIIKDTNSSLVLDAAAASNVDLQGKIIAPRRKSSTSSLSKKRASFASVAAVFQGDNAPAPGTRKRITKLLSDNIIMEEKEDGNLSQTCRHCNKNRVCKQTLTTAWSLHLVDTSKKGCPSAPLWLRKAVAAESSSTEVRNLAISQGWLREINEYIDHTLGPAGQDRKMIASPAAAAVGSPYKRAKTTTSRDSFVAKAADQQAMLLQVEHGECTQDQADTITLKIMQFLAGCEQSMILLQSPFFLEMLRAMNEDYVTRCLPKSDVFLKSWLPKLHQSIQKDLGNLWKQHHQKGSNLGSLGFWERDDSDGGPIVKVLSEGILDKMVFWENITANNAGEQDIGTPEGLALHLCRHMIARAGGKEDSVYDLYAALITTTTTSASMGSTADVSDLVQTRFPKLFVNRCRLQVGQLIRKHILRVPEIALVISKAQFIANFILDHPYSASLFWKLTRETGEIMPIRVTAWSFSDIETMLNSVCGTDNSIQVFFMALVKDTEWTEEASQTLDPQLVKLFETLADDKDLFPKFQALTRLISPLAAFEKHLNRSDVRASWLFPLCEALSRDAFEWCSDATVRQFFKQETFDEVNVTIMRYWKGDPPHYQQLYSPQILMAMLLDPTTCPISENLPEDWDNESEKVMKRFYSGKDLLDANGELMTLLDHQGRFGREVERYEDALKTVLPDPTGRCHVQQVVDRQLPAIESRPNLVWKLSLKSSFPKLYEISRRLLVMGTSSADASWTSKVIKATSMNTAKSPSNKNVSMLLYCNINLQIINMAKGETVLVKEKGAKKDSFEQFLEQAVLEDAETPSEQIE